MVERLTARGAELQLRTPYSKLSTMFCQGGYDMSTALYVGVFVAVFFILRPAIRRLFGVDREK